MEEVKDKPLTIKALQKHIIYTIVGCIIITIIGGLTTSFTFYYKTTNELENIHNHNKKQDESINEIFTIVNNFSIGCGQKYAKLSRLYSVPRPRERQN